jgi:hypothetical protein
MDDNSSSWDCSYSPRRKDDLHDTSKVAGSASKGNTFKGDGIVRAFDSLKETRLGRSFQDAQ